jgi:hypothetical protein
MKKIFQYNRNENLTFYQWYQHPIVGVNNVEGINQNLKNKVNLDDLPKQYH